MDLPVSPGIGGIEEAPSQLELECLYTRERAILRWSRRLHKRDWLLGLELAPETKHSTFPFKVWHDLLYRGLSVVMS